MSETKRNDLPADAELEALERAVEAFEQGNRVKEKKAEKRETLAAEQFKSVMLDNKITRISEVNAPRGKPGATAPPEGDSESGGGKPPAVQDPKEAERNQYLVALVTLTMSSLWVTWFGVDMPKEVYAAIPAVLVVGGQLFATRFNNRKV